MEVIVYLFVIKWQETLPHKLSGKGSSELLPVKFVTLVKGSLSTVTYSSLQGGSIDKSPRRKLCHPVCATKHGYYSNQGLISNNVQLKTTPTVSEHIVNVLGRTQLDLFAFHFYFKLPTSYSWRTDSVCLEVGVFFHRTGRDVWVCVPSNQPDSSKTS